MMNELLKNNLLEVNRDMSILFQQTYNFKDRQTKNQWLTDSKNEEAANKLIDKKSNINNKNKLLAGIHLDGKEPWGWWYKAEDLPPETFEPPSTP